MMTRNTQLGSMSVLVHLVIVELSRVRHPDMVTWKEQKEWVGVENYILSMQAC